MLLKFPKQFLLLLGILFSLNILQSIFTELIYDESYYWYYAQNLAWGYFDHPPMVALMIKIGLFFSKGELGVRLISCCLGMGTLVLLWSTIDHREKKENVLLFFLLVFAMPLMNAYGFFTLPDTPLLFFTALFLYLYKDFLQQESVWKSLFLGLTMAAMMYSKYHAALIIIFVLLSNLALLKNKLAWLAVAVALACYVPHLYWLYENDFVSLDFHIFERPNQAYTFDGNTLGYLLNLIVIFGLAFPWVYWALFKAKGKTPFKKALLFLTLGFIAFFFLSSFNRRSQAQWTITICIPMIIITYEFLMDRDTARKWFFRIGATSVVLLLYARLWLIYEPLFPMLYETHGNKAWAERIEKEVGNTPVVIENSYRMASMYRFYSGNTSYTLNNMFYRYNQYSIDDSEQAVQHKKVAYLSKYYPAKDFIIKHKDSSVFNGTYFHDFTSYRKLRCFLDGDKIDFNTKNLTLKVFNPYGEDIPTQKLSFFIGYMDAYKKMKQTNTLRIRDNHLPEYLSAKDTTTINVSIPDPKFDAFPYARFGILENGIFPGLNSKPYTIDASD